MKPDYPYHVNLHEHRLVYELLKRKLRTAIVQKVITRLRAKDLRHIFYTLHREKPQPGQIPSLEMMTQTRESFLYMAVFASIYRCAHRGDFKANMDIEAVMFAWDYFCETFPGHIRERRPFGKIRPANFDEAWVIAEAMQTGLVELQYCFRCHHNFLVTYCTRYQPVCQVCALKSKNKRGI